MKLRLTEPGFATYTGQMGVVDFVDGLSIGDVLTIDGIRISAAIGAEWEDGSASNVGEMYLSAMDVPAHVGTQDFKPVAAPEPEPERPIKGSLDLAPPAEQYTRESLAAVADKSGIAGLREIADKLGIKGMSINGLIDSILKTPQGIKQE